MFRWMRGMTSASSSPYLTFTCRDLTWRNNGRLPAQRRPQIRGETFPELSFLHLKPHTRSCRIGVSYVWAFVCDFWTCRCWKQKNKLIGQLNVMKSTFKFCYSILGKLWQISIIPKPELRGFWGSSLIKPPFRVTSADVVIICPVMYLVGWVVNPLSLWSLKMEPLQNLNVNLANHIGMPEKLYPKPCLVWSNFKNVVQLLMTEIQLTSWGW